MIFDFLKKKKYSHFFVYKWGVLAGIVEFLFVLFSAFCLTNLNELFLNNKTALSIATTFYFIIGMIISFLIAFGMPIYLVFRKKMFSTAILVLLITIATLFVLSTMLFLILLI